MSTIASSITRTADTSPGLIALIVLAIVAALVLLAAVLVLLRPTRRKGNGRPPARQWRPLHPPATDADWAQEHRDIARRAARWSARCFSDRGFWWSQAACFWLLSSCSTSLGVR